MCIGPQTDERDRYISSVPHLLRQAPLSVEGTPMYQYAGVLEPTLGGDVGSLEICQVMTKMNRLRPYAFALAGVLVSVSLAGCDQKKEAAAPAPSATAPALPLTTGPATAVVPAPAEAALPKAPRIRVVRVANESDNYAYVDRAYEMSSAIGQAPPDYDFDYDGVHLWVWRSSNREVRLMEPVAGGYRSYYYARGASEPYLVRTPRYSYGYSDGQLVTVYDDGGSLLPPDYIDERADDAGRYLARGTDLYEASIRSERRSVNAANWAEQRDEIDAARSRWEDEQRQQDGWRSYHAQHEAEDQAYWRDERDQRDRSARTFNDWRSRGYNGPPPSPVNNSEQGNSYGPAPTGQGAGVGSMSGAGWSRDGNRPTQAPGGMDRQRNGAPQYQQQMTTDQARAQQQAQAIAVQQAQAKANAARQLQAKAAAGAAARTQQLQSQAAAAHAQQQAQAIAAQQAQVKANAARQLQVKAAADAAARTQQLQSQAAAAHAQQQAQAAAALQAQAKANAARQLQAKAAADAAAKKPTGTLQPVPATAQPMQRPTKEQIDALRAAAKKKALDAATGKAQAQ